MWQLRAACCHLAHPAAPAAVPVRCPPAVPPHATPATLHCHRRRRRLHHRPSRRPSLQQHSDHTALVSIVTRTAATTPPSHLPHPHRHSRHGHSRTAIALRRRLCRSRIAVALCEPRRSHRPRGSRPQWQVFAVRHARRGTQQEQERIGSADEIPWSADSSSTQQARIMRYAILSQLIAG